MQHGLARAGVIGHTPERCCLTMGLLTDANVVQIHIGLLARWSNAQYNAIGVHSELLPLARGMERSARFAFTRSIRTVHCAVTPAPFRSLP